MGNNFCIKSGISTSHWRYNKLRKPVRLMATFTFLLACIDFLFFLTGKLFAYVKNNLLPVTVKKVGARGQPVWSLTAILVVIKAWLYSFMSRWHYDRCVSNFSKVV